MDQTKNTNPKNYFKEKQHPAFDINNYLIICLSITYNTIKRDDKFPNKIKLNF